MNRHSLDWFWEGCEAQGPYHVTVKLPGQPRTVQRLHDLPFAIVGRHVSAHLQLENVQVSMRHAYFQLIGGHHFVLDLGSPTGIHRKSGAVRAGWVPRGELVGIGPYWLRWWQESAADGAGPLPGYDPLTEYAAGKSLLPLSLEFLNGKTSRPRWLVDRALTLIGSAAGCKVRLRSARIAPFHCSLIWTPRGAWIVDLLGEGGIRLNGIRVPFAALEHDDRLQVGEFVIRVCCGATPGAPWREGARTKTRSSPVADIPQGPLAVNGRPLPPMSLPPGALPGFALNPGSALLPPVSAMHLPGLAAPGFGADPAHAALGPLLSQFGAMQEQMADQFRQTLMMMFQMFSALHKDQMAFFQQELDRVQELTQELRLLQIEAAQHVPVQAGAEPGPEAPAVGLTSIPAGAPPQTAPALAAAKPNGSAASITEPAPSASVATSEVPASAAAARTRAASPESGSAPAATAGQDIHVWLCQRMAAIQEERQTRWQKLLGMVGGKPHGV